MKKYTFLFLIIGISFFSACKIQEEIHFKKDMSGRMTYSIDMSMMRMMTSQAKTITPNERDSSAMSIPPQDLFGMLDTLDQSELKKPLEGLAGISNLKASREGGGISVSFDFKDLNALNRAYSRLGSLDKLLMNSGTKGFQVGEAPDEKSEEKPTDFYNYFTQKGSTLTFSRPNKNPKAKSNMDAQMGEAMEAMFEYKSTITFDKKVKSLKSQNINASQEENSIVIKGNKKNLEESSSIKIKLK